MDMITENFPTIASLVGTEQGRLVKLGLNQSEARKLATTIVGATLTPPITPGELGTWMGLQARHARTIVTQDTPIAREQMQFMDKNTLGITVSTATFPATPRSSQDVLAGTIAILSDLKPTCTFRCEGTDIKRMRYMQSCIKHAAVRLKWGQDGKGVNSYRSTVRAEGDAIALYIERLF